MPQRKRKRRSTPIALLWTRRDQLRFTDAVEKLIAAVHDLEGILAPVKRKRAAKVAAAAAANAQENGTHN